MDIYSKKTKLKDADIKKVDFVHAGAQQDAKISIFKSADASITNSLFDYIKKSLMGFKIVPMDDSGECADETGIASTFDEELQEELVERTVDEIMEDFWIYTHSLRETIRSIICSTEPDKTLLLQGALDQFSACVVSGMNVECPIMADDSIMKAVPVLSTERMNALKECMKIIAQMLSDAEQSPQMVHTTDIGEIESQPGMQPSVAKTKTNMKGGNIIMDDVLKAGVPQETLDYIVKIEAELEVAKSAPKGTPVEEDIFKGLPEAVAKMLQEQNVKLADANEKIAKMRDESETKIFIAKAAELTSNLGVVAEEFGPVLKSINAANPELAAKVEAVLKTANETVKKGNLFTEIGTTLTGSPTGIAKNDAWSSIQTLAQGLVTKGESKTEADAIDAVLKSEEGRKLYAIYTGKIKG